MLDFEEKTVSSEYKYKGKIINFRIDNVKLPDGQVHFREIIEHPGGVVIIPVVNKNKLAMVKQWRHPVKKELIEFPAGKLEPGEDPFEAAKRELQEETGFVAETWEYLGFIYTTPGFSDEKLYFYKAEELTFTQTDFDDGEIIEPFLIETDKAFEMIKDGEINDSKSIVGLSYLKIIK